MPPKICKCNQNIDNPCVVCRARQRCRDYKKANKERISQYNKQYKQEHQQEISEYNHYYNILNREIITENATVRMRERLENDPIFKLGAALRGKINRILHRKTITDDYINLIGCSNKMFLQWFENLFSEEMSFANYGTVWHVDHIVPITAFSEENIKDYSCHWSNLRPTFILENQSKTNKIIYDIIIDHYKKAFKFWKNWQNMITQPLTWEKYVLNKEFPAI